MTTITAANRREAARAEFAEWLADCPSRQVLETVSGRWASLVLSVLATGPRRYGELTRDLPGASRKMLTQTLRTLERDGLVTREVTPATPVRVDYSLSLLGQTLLPTIRALKEWADTHIDDIRAARDTYDRAQAPNPARTAGHR